MNELSVVLSSGNNTLLGYVVVLEFSSKKADSVRTCSDNKIREFATMCLPWQHWTKALVCFNDVDISAFHSCVVVNLWQSLPE